AAPVESSINPPEPSLDPLDEAALTAVLASTEDLGRPERFDNEVTYARKALEDTEYTAYEAALVLLGTLVGAYPSLGNDDDAEEAEPDAVWIFGDIQWVIWEAKSMAKDKGQIGAD